MNINNQYYVFTSNITNELFHVVHIVLVKFSQPFFFHIENKSNKLFRIRK